MPKKDDKEIKKNPMVKDLDSGAPRGGSIYVDHMEKSVPYQDIRKETVQKMFKDAQGQKDEARLASLEKVFDSSKL